MKGVIEIVQEQPEYAQLLAVNEKDAAEVAVLDIIKDWFTVKSGDKVFYFNWKE